MAQLLRFTSAGALDASFGGSGEVTCCGVGPLNWTGASAVALQPDGKTVFAGTYREYIATGTIAPAPTYVLVGRVH
jgi:hypothetical protein